MGEHAVVQPQKTNTPQKTTMRVVALQRRATNQAQSATLPERLFDVVSGTFMEPRFGYDFSRVRLRADETLSSLRVRPMVQRFPSNGATALAPDIASPEAETAPTPALAEPTTEPASPEAETTPAPAEPTTEAATPDETAAPGLLVEDSATELAPEQMRKSEFLTELRAAVCAATEPVLVRTGRTTEGCPYLDYWFDYYSQRDAQHGERALRRYAPEASRATAARDYIPIVADRVRQGVERWVSTGEVSGVPEGVPTTVPGDALPAQSGEGIATSTGPVMFKAREGGARAADDPQAIQTQLGDGRPLESGVRSRMESAFGTSFGHVRTHTDSNASTLSHNLNARAFTVGEHVAFGASEYRPGTLLGDALIAHELAHVVQQSGAGASVTPMRVGDASCNVLEDDADRSAVGALVSLWGDTKTDLADIVQNAIPRMRSGLRLQRCETKKVKCPTQTVTAGSTSCGVSYGANMSYCYGGAKNWWFKERVRNGPGPLCQPGTINQTTTPIQSTSGCVTDQIFNNNGPPARVAPCTDTTFQTVFTGPTKADVEMCKYLNTQVIEVTETPGSSPRSGKVITSSAGVSTDCAWP